MKKKSISQSAFLKLRVLSAVLVLLSVQLGHARSATWALNPQSNDWNTAANWRPPTVPNRCKLSWLADVIFSELEEMNNKYPEQNYEKIAFPCCRFSAGSFN